MSTTEKVHDTSKEYLYALRFPQEDVMTDKSSKSVRLFCVKRAMRLGNLLKNKVTIYFKDSQEKLIRIKTTVWGVTQKDVILKKGSTIPLHRIVSIDD